MRFYLRLTFLCLILPFQLLAQSNGEQDSAYTKTITLRADKIVAPLGMADSMVTIKVRDIIVSQYRALNEIHTAKDEKLKSAKIVKATNKDLADELSRNATNEAAAALYNLHFDYLSKLLRYLDEEKVEMVKDGMTYGVLPITYMGYCDMIRDLTEAQKRQIKVWLVEAREHAMDAGSSDEKHQWFGKYKGRINNYLSAAGYDLKKEGEEWQTRIKASKNQANQ